MENLRKVFCVLKNGKIVKDFFSQILHTHQKGEQSFICIQREYTTFHKVQKLLFFGRKQMKKIFKNVFFCSTDKTACSLDTGYFFFDSFTII